MNRADLLELPPVLDVPMAAKLLRVSRTQAYDLIRSGDWPTPVFRMGKLIRIPTAPLLDLVGFRPGQAGDWALATAATAS